MKRSRLSLLLDCQEFLDGMLTQNIVSFEEYTQYWTNLLLYSGWTPEEYAESIDARWFVDTDYSVN